jgi:phage tail-like protein
MPIQITGIKGEPYGLGHSVKLTWNNPSEPDFKEVAIHRRVDQFSLDPASPFSIEIYRGTATEIYDYHQTNPAVSLNNLPNYDALTKEEQNKWLLGETVYYYTFFAVDQEGNHYASLGNTKAVTPTARYGLGKWFYKQLPQIYRTMDAERNEDIKRFCEILGVEFDHLYSLIRMGRFLLDPSKLNPEYLEVLSKMLGWNLDKNLPLVTQRRILQKAVSFYMYSGTKKGLTALVKYYSGFPDTSSVYEQYPNIFRTPYFGLIPEDPVIYAEDKTPDMLTLDITNINTSQDTLYYTWDFSPNAIIADNRIIIDIHPTVTLTEAEKEVIRVRVARIVDEFTPVNVNYEIRIQ